MQREVVIETRGLVKKFGDVRALQGLDLLVPRHSIFGFLGPNGAGKTTTMKLLLGLNRPTAGTATIFGLDIEKESLAIRTRIGYLPQQPRFYENMSARETLRFTAGFFFKGPKHRIEERVGEMLALVDLEKKADRPIRGFSGGERQRLGLAQAQINYPDLLILDEPAAALDPLGRQSVLRVMEQLREQSTIFYSTHILDDVQQVSDSVAILSQGKLITQGPIDRLLNSSGSIVFHLAIRGDDSRALARFNDLPWVTQIERGSKNGLTHWQVCVSDEEIAEKRLLRLLLADESLVVAEFSRKKYELEEVFITLVNGENDAG